MVHGSSMQAKPKPRKNKTFFFCSNCITLSFRIFVENEKKVHFSTFRFHEFWIKSKFQKLCYLSLWNTLSYDYDKFKANLLISKIHTVFARLSAPPLFFAEIWGPASAKDCLLMLNLPPEVTKTKSDTIPLALSGNQHWVLPCLRFLHALPLAVFGAKTRLWYWPINNLVKYRFVSAKRPSQELEREGIQMATVTAIYRPFLAAVRNTAIGTHWGVRLYRCLTKPLLRKIFPNLYSHQALNRANTVFEATYN